MPAADFGGADILISRTGYTGEDGCRDYLRRGTCGEDLGATL